MYQRIKTHGLTIDKLVEDSKTGELSPEGCAIIRQLFNKDVVKNKASEVDHLRSEINDKQRVIETLQLTIEKLNAEMVLMREQIDTLKRDKDSLQDMQRIMYINSLPWYKRRKAEKQLLLPSGSIKSDV